MKNLYTTEEETNALIKLDKRTLEQKKAAELADKNWMNEQGAEPQRTWINLTYQEQEEIVSDSYSIRDCVQRTATKLREKNQ